MQRIHEHLTWAGMCLYQYTFNTFNSVREKGRENERDVLARVC